jgi:uncharacterized OB-fold protein
LKAARCPDGHYHHPPHPRCPDCGAKPTERIDLSDREAVIVTWTTVTATPPGVRKPNHLAIVEFDLGDRGDADGTDDEGDGDPGNGDDADGAIGGLTTDDAAIGDRVRPVYVERLREPEAGIREPDSQEWDGYRFEPI